MMLKHKKHLNRLRLIIKRLCHILNLLYEVASTTRILTLKNNLVLIILQQNMLLVKSCHEDYFVTCILTLKTIHLNIRVLQ